MKIKDVIGKAVKEAILPELTLLRGDIGELRADVKVISGRLDAVEKRMDHLDKRMDELKDDIREVREENKAAIADLKDDIRDLKNGQKALQRDVAEVRSYVWTSGMKWMMGQEPAPLMLHEEPEKGYGKDGKD